MANFNKVFLMGNLTRDVEVRHTQGGTAVGKLGIAVNRRYTLQGGEQKEETCFVDLTAFGRQAETLQKYVGKGSPLFVEGRLQFSSWEGNDGQKRNKLEVIIENFQFLGGRSSEGGGGGGGGGGNFRGGGRSSDGNAGGEQVDYTDIPF